MNTKTFAQESRNLLMDGVAKKLLYWGFDTNGNVLEQPNKLSGGYTFRGEVFDDPNVPQLWDSLKHAVQHKGIEVVVEEAAYTWFNRMMALRIMVKNGYEQPQLENVTGMEHTPVMLQKARQGHYGFLNKGEQERLKKIIGDYSKDQEAFALLLVGYCHANKTLDKVFGKLDDYTELLLPDNMLQDSGFLHLLNTTDAISDEEYKQVELIGWLYQFYISEKKDEVFASFKKNKKAEAKDIPAATQIFTPNWIVKYMVENTAGKIWLDKHPNSPLKGQMKYLVTNDDAVSSSAQRIENKAIINSVEELTLIDPAAGSGHILVEGFELLYQMYMEEYYTPEEAVESILKNNLFGLDIDDRASQLATFAILLKAAKKYRDIWHKDWLPNVHAMPESQDFSMQEVKDFLGAEGTDYAEELEAALRLMKQAKNLGSVMKLNVSEAARMVIEKRFTELEHTEYRDFNIEAIYQNLKYYIPVLLILTKKYTSVVANPPYMGQKNMNADLKNYVNANYPRSKSDLFAVFMESTLAMNIDKGLMGMINQHSWMFLSSYEKLRNHILDNYGILNMLHLGPRTFEELTGEVVQSTAFVLKNGNETEHGNYYRLVDYRTVHEKERAFLNKENEFLNIPQTNFDKIHGSPISYWTAKVSVSHFENNKPIGEYLDVKQGLTTSDNKRFLRFWSEVEFEKVGFGVRDRETAIESGLKWFPYNKGGGVRKWYGNQEYLVNWENDGFEIKALIVKKYPYLKGNPDFVAKNPKFYFRDCVTWSKISGGKICFRLQPKGIIFSDAGMGIFASSTDLINLLSEINSKHVFEFLKSINPTLNYQAGDIQKLPLITPPSDVESIGRQNVLISKKDWDSRETSWDFEQSPLLNKTNSLEQAVQSWQERATQDFFQLHTNEEELNRIFINIYGLQEELTPDVALKDITILQEELNKKDMEVLEAKFRAKGANAITLPIDKGEVISQFISYAIGLFMGRYRLDKTGLNIAHPNPTAEELESYSYTNGQVIIDEDAILPLMGKNCNFPDDALQQFQQVLDTIWGHETRTENINFIQDCLDKDLEKFLVKDFYKYHCKMYKKKPIYWLFASPKGAFQVLVYMHRMNAFTVEKIRANYLLEHIKNINSEIMVLESNASNLNTQEAKRLDTLRVDLRECETYDMELKNVADQQISFELDDGVTVNYKKFETVVAKIK
ncbi:BREX-1 system adenine-specific DNA-methyltransferase PglX [Algibacter sp.]|nr:BREX-1 system adenine-specific DNA-methyltransferase PglX [Algibacter sp.]